MRITRHPLLAPVGGLRQIPSDDSVIDRLEAGYALIAHAGDGVLQRWFERLDVSLSPDRRSILGHGAERTARRQRCGEAIAAVVAGLHDSITVRATLHALGQGLAREGVTRRECTVSAAAFERTLRETFGSRWSPDLADEWSRAMAIAVETMFEATPAGCGPISGGDRTSRVPVRRPMDIRSGHPT